MSDDQDLALKKCVFKEFTPQTKDATLSTATTFGDNLFQTWITRTAKTCARIFLFLRRR